MTETTTGPYLHMGDRIVIEPLDTEPLAATVLAHHGWGLVHGEMVIGCKRDDNGDRFTYGIQYDAPISVVARAAASA